ncbi:MAG TPA: DUF3667 domain-containing protein [Rhizomicrobium sp.]|nr:DUF3667 domain-containing protein [Rhizomicrobium sp.]
MSDFEAILETGGAAAVEMAASALAERGQRTEKCPNCSTSMIGAYCAVCGQERDTHRRSLLALLHDLFEDIISFDSRVMRTAYALLARPGELPSAFREGRTQRYMPAVRLYLFVSLIFFLILSFSGIAIVQLQVTATPEKVIRDAKGNTFILNPAYDKDDPDMPRLLPIPKEKANAPGGPFSFSTVPHFFSRIGGYQSNLTKAERDRLVSTDVNVDVGTSADVTNAKDKRKSRAAKNWVEKHVYDGIQRLAADPAAMNGPLTTWIPRVLFLLLPLYAVLLALFYWRQRKKFYFVDHLVFSLSVHTFAFAVLIMAVGAAQLLPGGIVAWSALGAVTLYLFLSIKHFYEQSWFWTSVKFIAISSIYTIFFLLPALASVLAASFLQV